MSRRTRARENTCEILTIELPECNTVGPMGRSWTPIALMMCREGS